MFIPFCIYYKNFFNAMMHLTKLSDHDEQNELQKTTTQHQQQIRKTNNKNKQQKLNNNNNTSLKI